MQPQRIVIEGSKASETLVSVPRTPLREAHEADSYAASPALALQQSLASQLSEPHVERWPLAARIAFMAASSTLLWAGIIAVGLRLAQTF